MRCVAHSMRPWHSRHPPPTSQSTAFMIQTNYYRCVELSRHHIEIRDIRFTVCPTKVEARFSIRSGGVVIKLTMTHTADDSEWQEDIESLDLVRAIVTVAPETFSWVESALDNALAEIIPLGRSLPNDDRDYGWAICDERADPDRVLEMGPTATHARIAAMCARGPNGKFKGLVAREFTYR